MQRDDLHNATGNGESLPRGWGKALHGFVASLEREGYSPYTIRDYRSDVVRLARRVGTDPAGLDQHHVLLAARDLEAEGMPEPYRRRRIAAWHRFESWVKSRSGEPLAAQALDAAAGLSVCERVLVGLIGMAGMRPGEVAKLEGRDLRLKQGVVICRSGLRIIPVTARLQQILTAYRAELPLPPYRPLLPGPSGFPVNTRTLHARFHRICQRIGMPALQPEHLRRDVASRLRSLGTPPGLIRAFLGKDRGRTCAPRKGAFNDLASLKPRLDHLFAEPERDRGGLVREAVLPLL